MKILVIEDEANIIQVIRLYLEQAGFTVLGARDGVAGLELHAREHPDLVILDLMLPGLDGLALCRHIRQHHLFPIVMLTARNEEVDRILGLEVGADDYMSKPFSTRELVARVRALLRRVELDTRTTRGHSGEDQGQPPLQANVAIANALIIHGPLHINTTERLVLLDGKEIELTPKEYELLLLLTSHARRAFSREFLLQHIWGYEYDGFDRTVDTHITRLRKKLGSFGDTIVTVWSVGYRFVL